jgi:hypothetical protein
MSTTDYPDLPDFLKIHMTHAEWLEQHKANWKGRKLTRQGSSFKAPPSKVEEAATRALRRELERQEEEKKAQRFARLRELREEQKAAGVKVHKRRNTHRRKA